MVQAFKTYDNALPLLEGFLERQAVPVKLFHYELLNIADSGVIGPF